MSTVQLNLSKIIDYRRDINYGRVFNIDNNTLIFENKAVSNTYELSDSVIDFINHSRFNHMYAHYGILEHMYMSRSISRNIDFEGYKSAYVSEFIKQPNPWMEAHRMVINRMINSAGHKIRYYKYENSTIPDIVKCISSGNPFVMTVYYSIDDKSEGFYNTLLVNGIVRDLEGNMVGITCHDYSGDANSNYVNKNGNRVTYHGNMFRKITALRPVVVGIPVEEVI